MDYNTLISLDNLFSAWEEFRKGKRGKKDVQVFERHMEDNLFQLHDELVTQTYGHGGYEAFYVNDPKRRHIHKASVRDRVVHHLLYTYLYKLFDSQFIYDSYSCRVNKGTHKAVDRLEVFTRKVSKNYSQDCWVLHLDIQKFFASVDHGILKGLLKKKIEDIDIYRLMCEVIDSYWSVGDSSPAEGGIRMTADRKGIPLGNLTSQVFANIYLNELDQFIKHTLRIKYYIRYADDFVIVLPNQERLAEYIPLIQDFLTTLNLNVHPKKITNRNLTWGMDFLGYIVLPHYRLPRTKTKRRVFNKVSEKLDDLENDDISYDSFNQSIQSYKGYLKHANSYKIQQDLENIISVCIKRPIPV